MVVSYCCSLIYRDNDNENHAQSSQNHDDTSNNQSENNATDELNDNLLAEPPSKSSELWEWMETWSRKLDYWRLEAFWMTFFTISVLAVFAERAYSIYLNKSTQIYDLKMILITYFHSLQNRKRARRIPPSYRLGSTHYSRSSIRNDAQLFRLATHDVSACHYLASRDSRSPLRSLRFYFQPPSVRCLVGHLFRRYDYPINGLSLNF